MKKIKLRGINYCFEDLNPDKKDTLLLVHGHPFDHTMWQYQLDVLKCFRLIIPDLRGYGQTDYCFEKIFIEDHALDLVFLLDLLRIGKVHLLGLSMGAQIIIEFGRLFPHRTSSLVICSGNPFAETKLSYRNRLQLANQIIWIGMQEYTMKNIHRYLGPSAFEAKGKVYDHIFHMMTHTAAEGAAASLKGRAERRDNYFFLRNIDKPALIVAGDQDSFTSVDEMQRTALQIPNSKFLVIKDTGHLPDMEQPDVFNVAISNFYKKIR